MENSHCTRSTATGHLRSGRWTADEKKKIPYCRYLVEQLGKSWDVAAKEAGLNRKGHSCRRRWIEVEDPELKRDSFSEEEDAIIFVLHSIPMEFLRWSQIAKWFPGRTDDMIKSHWNNRLEKKHLKMGIDLRKHGKISPDDIVLSFSNPPNLAHSNSCDRSNTSAQSYNASTIIPKASNSFPNTSAQYGASSVSLDQPRVSHSTTNHYQQQQQQQRIGRSQNPTN